MGFAGKRRPTSGLDIGLETGTTVVPDYGVESSEFTGELDWMEFKVGDDHTHMVDLEEPR